jgi:hypothetical protein
MKRRNRVYRRTASGRKAWGNEESGLPPTDRKILGLIDQATDSHEVIRIMPESSEEQILAWLDELETLCYVACNPTPATDEPVRRQVAHVAPQKKNPGGKIGRTDRGKGARAPVRRSRRGGR